jgi:DNA-binding LacI/PurR family transcriptional regulator
LWAIGSRARTSAHLRRSRGSSRDAVQYLIELGHRRSRSASTWWTTRITPIASQVIARALEAAGIEIDDRLIQRCPAHREGGAQLIRRLMTIAPRPTAVYVTDPMAAIGAMNEAQRLACACPKTCRSSDSTTPSSASKSTPR